MKKKTADLDFTTKEGKKALIKRHTGKTNLLKTTTLACLGGGLICAVGEGLRHLYVYLGATDKDALTLVSLTMVAIAAILTALGCFDRIAKHLGGGTLVPITGFSNSVVSEAIDSRSEGFVLGVGAKIFTVAGPVILFGIASGVLYGIIYYLYGFFTSVM